MQPRLRQVSLDALDSSQAYLKLKGFVVESGREVGRLQALLRASGVPVVLGGIHPTVAPQEAARHADAVWVGEAEGYWPQLWTDFCRGELKPLYRNETFAQPVRVPIPRREL